MKEYSLNELTEEEIIQKYNEIIETNDNSLTGTYWFCKCDGATTTQYCYEPGYNVCADFGARIGPENSYYFNNGGTSRYCCGYNRGMYRIYLHRCDYSY